jgi:hypothetical protein
MSASAHHPLFKPAPTTPDEVEELIKVIDMELQCHHPECNVRVFDTQRSIVDLARIVLYLLQRNR